MTTTETAPAERHWLTKYDQDNGEPYGQLCDCEIGKHHDGNGDLSEPDDESDATTPATDIGTDNPSPEIDAAPLTLTEFVAAQLCSKHIIDGLWVEMRATADGTRIHIDIEHPFPPASRLRVVAHLEVVVPGGDEVDAVEQSGVEIGASA